MTALRRAALDYAAAGYEVFPLRGKLPHGNCPECDPRSPRHRPHRAADCDHELCHGLYAATTDPGRVAGWWRRWPQANIGARVPRSLLVLDVDPRSGGDRSLERLEAANLRLPLTRTSYSGRSDGGHHRWFLHPGGRPSAARLGDGLDVKTHHGYVLLPPSRHPATRRPYWWAVPLGEPVPVPAWLRRLLLPEAPPSPPVGSVHLVDTPRSYWEQAAAAELAQLTDEGGHDALVRSAFRLGQLAHLGIPEDETVAALAAAALVKANPPRDRSAALRTARECFAAGRARPRQPSGRP